MSLKNPITEAQRAQVLALAGTTSTREIARRTGVSKTTVLRVLADAPDDASDDDDVAPDVAPDEVIPAVVPNGTPVETIRRWQANVERWSQQAERIGNLAVLASLTARQATLIEAERRATPPPVEDPNTHPDMIKEAEAARTKVFGEIESFLASKVTP
jgi:hypothetical protein